MSSHYITAFCRVDATGQQQAACGAACSDKDYSAEPTCADCQAWLDALNMPTVTDESKIAALRATVAELQQAILQMECPF